MIPPPDNQKSEDQTRLDALQKAWRVTTHGGIRASRTALVAFGEIDGRPVAVKLARGDDERCGGDALRQYAGHGAARLLAAKDGAPLLERAVPGVPLRTAPIPRRASRRPQRSRP